MAGSGGHGVQVALCARGNLSLPPANGSASRLAPFAITDRAFLGILIPRWARPTTNHPLRLWHEVACFTDAAYSPGVFGCHAEPAGYPRPKAPNRTEAHRVVVIFKLKRVLRSTDEWTTFRAFLQEHDCRLVSTTEDLSPRRHALSCCSYSPHAVVKQGQLDVGFLYVYTNSHFAGLWRYL